MRRRRSRLSTAAVIAAVVVSLAGEAGAQRGSANEGAIFLLLPVGARAVGMGQATVADRPGSEAVWWNPAALARLEKVEAAIHHSQSVIGTGDAVALVVPSSLLGVLAASINMLDFGEQEVTDPEAGTTGRLLLRSFVYAASYATTVGDHVSAGISYKVLQFRVDCTGACPTLGNIAATTSAIDLGAQYDVDPWLPLTVGLAVRNLGPRLQVNDREQSDRLPQRLQAGVLYRVAGIEDLSKDTELHLTGDVIGELDLRTPAGRLGADAIWRKRVHLRAGYAFDASDGSGPAVGLGIDTGSLVFDIARIFDGFSADAGQAPTYFSLRYLF